MIHVSMFNNQTVTSKNNLTFAALACLITCTAATLGWSAEPALERFERTERHMGVDCSVILYAANAEAAQPAFEACFAIFAHIDRIASDYSPESELSLLAKQSPTPEPVKLSDDLWQLLRLSQAFSERSEGAFDITVGPLTKLWRRAKRQRELPTDDELRSALAAVGWQKVGLFPEQRAVSLHTANMRLDLGGIAQGYAADLALAKLRELGITRALIDISGDIRCGEAPPHAAGWRVGIAPLTAEGAAEGFILLTNAGLATSGDAFRGVEIGGVRYSHIVDPHTGIGLQHRSSVTIIAPQATTADALSTAVSVLGAEAGLALLEKYPGTSGRIVWQDAAGATHERHSPTWKLERSTSGHSN